jgi:transcriptional regulator with XRE-family HTH domain
MAPVPKPKRKRTKHYFREWRIYRKITQEQAIGRLGWSQSKLSRIESGKTPYNEDDLADAAEAYQTSRTALQEINPLVEGEVVDFLKAAQEADPNARRAALAVLISLKAGAGKS